MKPAALDDHDRLLDVGLGDYEERARSR